MGNRHSDPFGNEGPALLANMIGDLAAGGKTFQFFERERRWTGDQAVHCEPPLRETAGQQALVGFILGSLSKAWGNFEISLRLNSRASEWRGINTRCAA